MAGGGVGTWQITSDLLARARFAVSPMAETVAAISALLRPRGPAARAFHAAHHAAFEAMLAGFPLRRDVLARSFRPRRGGQPGWIANYLALPPPAPAGTFDEELAAVAATPSEVLRQDLHETVLTPLPPHLASAELTQAAARVLEWVWTHTVATDWPRRERLLRADIVARTGQLASHGWAAVLRDLGRDVEWVGERCGQRRVIEYLFLVTSRAYPVVSGV
jgi:hypothetical protein